ncbi:hypothetical protein [Spirosoma aerophilum]
MTIAFSAVDHENQIREFLCVTQSFISVSRLLNSVADLGHTLINVRITDRDRELDFPFEACARQQFSQQMAQLEKEWMFILKKAILSNANIVKVNVK